MSRTIEYHEWKTINDWCYMSTTNLRKKNNGNEINREKNNLINFIIKSKKSLILKKLINIDRFDFISMAWVKRDNKKKYQIDQYVKN